jgi:NADH:ubiquinone oxidoreductase subunit 5 (subunit L)/multisubunit Na+/H+ antiporter MnhA subunit
LQSVERGLEHRDPQHSAPEGMGILYGGALLLAFIPPLVLFSGSYEYLWGITGFVSAEVGFKVIGLITVFVASQYLFKGVTSLFSRGPKTYWPASGQDSSVRPQLLNGSILTGLFLVTVVGVGLLNMFWSWFANFLAPALNIPRVALGEGAIENGFSFWLIVALLTAVAGWGYAYSTQSRSQHQVSRANGRSNGWYVLFWNKGYFDEIYNAYLVTPTLKFANWLWRSIDIKVIDNFIHSIAIYSVNFARWLWRIVDIRLIDRFIHFIAAYSVSFAGWLWRIVDNRLLEQKVGQAAEQVNATGKLLQEMESHTIQHQILVMMFWLGAMTGLLYIMVK